MSSITQAKAEAQKLIRQYNKLQAEAKHADTEEAARKASEAEKLVSQISSLQAAISKLQAKDREKDATVKRQPPAVKRTTSSPNTQTTVSDIKQVEEEKDILESRIARIEDAQKRTREQIDQLSRAKAELARLKNEAEQSVARTQRASDEKLQQELAKLIKRKEEEQGKLKEELEAIRKQAQKDAELLKVQRDAARAMMEKQRQLEREETKAKRRHHAARGLWVSLIIGMFSLLTGVIVILVTPWFDSVAVISQLKGSLQSETPKSSSPPKIVERPKAVNATEESAPEKPEVTITPVKSLGQFQDRLRNGGRGPLMVKLPEGLFFMGAKDSSPHLDERPQHKVALQGFSISKYEITFEEYDRFVVATGRKKTNDNGWGRGKQPIINVSWNDAVAYTKWLTEQTKHQYRLPTEREWEYAAKAGTQTLYWWGYKIERNKANCASCGSQWDARQPAPVGSFTPNPAGLYDMIGNVLEWTQSCYHTSYQNAPTYGNIWEGGNCSKRVARSSAFRTYEKDLRVTKRYSYSPQFRLETLGFRVVRVD